MGIVMWEVLARRDPFEGERTNLSVLQHVLWSATHNTRQLEVMHVDY
jgi:hypothetical protein